MGNKKKDYNLGAEAQAGVNKAAEAVAAAALNYSAKNADAAFESGMFEAFEDKSLPPILKSRGIKPGTVIIGEFDSFGEYNQDKIATALITVHTLDFNPEKKEFFRAGSRIAIPVAAVIARALGAGDELNDKKTPGEINEKIQANGYGKGTVIMMKYQGTGKERKNMNAPHLWEVKLRKPEGSAAGGKAKNK